MKYELLGMYDGQPVKGFITLNDIAIEHDGITTIIKSGSTVWLIGSEDTDGEEWKQSKHDSF